MIRNERQYLITKAQAEKFRTAIAAAAESPPAKTVHPRLRTASVDAMKAQLADLEHEIEDYEALKSGRGKKRFDGTLEAIGELLIKARIARGWTQEALGERLGLHMQKIQQYEASDYAGASLTRALDVARALGVKTTVTLELVPLPDKAALVRARTY